MCWRGGGVQLRGQGRGEGEIGQCEGAQTDVLNVVGAMLVIRAKVS